jgi:hypothetical protein
MVTVPAATVIVRCAERTVAALAWSRRARPAASVGGAGEDEAADDGAAAGDPAEPHPASTAVVIAAARTGASFRYLFILET